MNRGYKCGAVLYHEESQKKKKKKLTFNDKSFCD